MMQRVLLVGVAVLFMLIGCWLYQQPDMPVSVYPFWLGK